MDCTQDLLPSGSVRFATEVLAYQGAGIGSYLQFALAKMLWVLDPRPQLPSGTPACL